MAPRKNKIKKPKAKQKPKPKAKPKQNVINEPRLIPEP